MIWEQFEAAAPELAAVGRTQFEQSGVALIGTIRKDGSPRISCVEPCILDGVLYLGMMWQSRKALDLLQDPRLVVHNAVCTSTGDEVEFSLHGRAIEIRDPEVRRRYISERTYWQEPQFHLFSLDIESASLIEYGRGEQFVKVWPLGWKVTGRDLITKTIPVCTVIGTPSTRHRPLSCSSSIGKAILASRRASGAPTQKGSVRTESTVWFGSAACDTLTAIEHISEEYP